MVSAWITFHTSLVVPHMSGWAFSNISINLEKYGIGRGSNHSLFSKRKATFFNIIWGEKDFQKIQRIWDKKKCSPRSLHYVQGYSRYRPLFGSWQPDYRGTRKNGQINVALLFEKSVSSGPKGRKAYHIPYWTKRF